MNLASASSREKSIEGKAFRLSSVTGSRWLQGVWLFPSRTSSSANRGTCAGQKKHHGQVYGHVQCRGTCSGRAWCILQAQLVVVIVVMVVWISLSLSRSVCVCVCACVYLCVCVRRSGCRRHPRPGCAARTRCIASRRCRWSGRSSRGSRARARCVCVWRLRRGWLGRRVP